MKEEIVDQLMEASLIALNKLNAEISDEFYPVFRKLVERSADRMVMEDRVSPSSIDAAKQNFIKIIRELENHTTTYRSGDGVVEADALAKVKQFFCPLWPIC